MSNTLLTLRSSFYCDRAAGIVSPGEVRKAFLCTAVSVTLLILTGFSYDATFFVFYLICIAVSFPLRPHYKLQKYVPLKEKH